VVWTIKEADRQTDRQTDTISLMFSLHALFANDV